MKILKKNGWKHVRTESSHWIFVKDGCERPIPVPLHGNKNLGILAKRILKETGMLASGKNNLHESGGINQKKSKEKSHYQF